MYSNSGPARQILSQVMVKKLAQQCEELIQGTFALKADQRPAFLVGWVAVIGGHARFISTMERSIGVAYAAELIEKLSETAESNQGIYRDPDYADELDIVMRMIKPLLEGVLKYELQLLIAVTLPPDYNQARFVTSGSYQEALAIAKGVLKRMVIPLQ